MSGDTNQRPELNRETGRKSCMYTLTEYIEKSGIMSTSHYAYRLRDCTEDAVVDAISVIRANRDNGRLTASLQAISQRHLIALTARGFRQNYNGTAS